MGDRNKAILWPRTARFSASADQNLLAIRRIWRITVCQQLRQTRNLNFLQFPTCGCLIILIFMLRDASRLVSNHFNLSQLPLPANCSVIRSSSHRFHTKKNQIGWGRKRETFTTNQTLFCLQWTSCLRSMRFSKRLISNGPRWNEQAASEKKKGFQLCARKSSQRYCKRWWS